MGKQDMNNTYGEEILTWYLPLFYTLIKDAGKILLIKKGAFTALFL